LGTDARLSKKLSGRVFLPIHHPVIIVLIVYEQLPKVRARNIALHIDTKCPILESE
jgi:hypothetical protein